MISYYRTIEDELIETETFQDCSWINIIDPTPEEQKIIAKIINDDVEEISVLIDPDEIPRIEKDKNFNLIIFRVPYYDSTAPKIKHKTLPISIFLLPDKIITISLIKNDFILKFVENKIRDFKANFKSRFVLQLFLHSSKMYLDYLKEINSLSEQLELDLHKSMKNESLIELLSIEKSLVFFSTSLRANGIILERLTNSGIIKLYDEDHEILEDVIVENRQAIEMTDIYSNILSGMMDAFASVISNNLNIVMKLLTSFSIILMIPTLIASIYGMNVPLPFQHSHHAFFIVISISILLSLIGVIVFLFRKLF